LIFFHDDGQVWAQQLTLAANRASAGSGDDYRMKPSQERVLVHAQDILRTDVYTDVTALAPF
jgi:hypothetical protein